jgi:ABC transport system ATP-binding/permease protein
MGSVPLITLLDAHLALGDRPLLDGAQLTVRAGERLGLIGRNGTGKSTLLRILAGLGSLDDGERRVRDGLRITFVEQEPELPVADTLRESLFERATSGATAGALARADLGSNEPGRWQLQTRINEFLDRFELAREAAPATSSGGERKRAALALALASQPDLLLLDEPTNHLDITAIERLEDLLLKVPAAIVVTHDRAFLDRVATRIVELDRGVLRSYPGNFAGYEQRREVELAAEDTARRRLEKFWAQEEIWIRKGVEARRTRNEGRVRRLERLRAERDARRDRLCAPTMSLDAGPRSGQLVAELTEISKSFGGRALVEHLSMRILRGDRVGLVGPNGAGKSTLIRMILGTLAPDSGTVRLGTNLHVAYFDQLREQLDPHATVAETISPGSDWVQIGAERRHVIGYLGDYLFSARRALSPVNSLSGGERNRLLLARLFARPSNLLVLDEPTNDLDIESLELLEQILQDYAGTLLLVSHDRRFLDNIVTQTLAAEGRGAWREYVGGYSDWLRQRGPAAAERRPLAAAGKGPARSAAQTQAKPRVRPSYREQRELAALPDEIEALERELAEITARMSAPDYHLGGAEQVRCDARRIEQIETSVLSKFERWERLEQKRSRSE